MVDVALNFFTAFRTPEGELIMDHGKIIKNYLRGWFNIDFPASIPFDWFVLFVVSPEEEEQLPSSNRAIRLARILRLFKMARILRVVQPLARAPVCVVFGSRCGITRFA